MRNHTITRDEFHYFCNKKHKPILEIEPGERVKFEVNEVSSWQITKKSRAKDLLKIDDRKLYPLAGPIYVRGTEVGDALSVKIENVMPESWGWSAIIPGLGLLPEFKKPYLWIWDISNRKFGQFKREIKVPLHAFCGVMGVAPSKSGSFRVGPPGAHGGNMDIRHLTRGSRLLLPVWNKGALFSVGDIHAAQGDGEVSVTAIECPGEVTLKFDLLKKAKLETPRFFSSLTPSLAKKHFVTTGISPDLMEASRQAVRDMIRYLSGEYGLSSEEAYILCSVAGDLKIHEIVDSPNWVVGMWLPLDIFP
jgi:acetamidase/formamidase